jgi:hypothetical protein
MTMAHQPGSRGSPSPIRRAIASSFNQVVSSRKDGGVKSSIETAGVIDKRQVDLTKMAIVNRQSSIETQGSSTSGKLT